MSNQDVTIAGNFGGKRVLFVPTALPVYKQLLEASREGNYWARSAVSGLRALTSGRLGKNNVFIKPNHMVAHGREEFFVYLPGCKATAERLPNDQYKILDIEIDLNYFKTESNQKAGLFKGTKIDSSWSAKPIENGRIGNEKDRLVGISDAGYSNPDIAVNEIASRISQAPTADKGQRLDRNGFDFHYTPGNASLGGMVNYTKAVAPTTDTDIHGSAVLLAKTMYHSKNTVGVNWATEFGGSAVLTQAMKILVDQGVKLDNHTAFLFRPKTSPNEAVKLAHKLNMKLERDFSKTTAFDMIGNRDQLKVIWNRKKPNQVIRSAMLVGT